MADLFTTKSQKVTARGLGVVRRLTRRLTIDPKPEAATDLRMKKARFADPFRWTVPGSNQ